MSKPLPVIGSTEAWAGGAITRHAECLLAPNPSVMTLDGTNTWLIGAADAGSRWIVDPGPLTDGHGPAIERTLAQQDCSAAGILLTHGHDDHSAGAKELAQRLGCGVRALDPMHRLGSEGLTDGDVLDGSGVTLRVVATPGHTSDSLTYLLEEDQALLTGDTVLGRGTTVVAHPDGRLDQYLASLHRLRDLAEASAAAHVLPGHGPALGDPAGLLRAYLLHRQARLDQVRAALADGAETAADVVAVVYAEVPRAAWPAALLSVRAQLDYLQQA